jgi:hypothetical protein
MSSRAWNIRIEVWPHSTGNGSKADLEACGERYYENTTMADTIDEALSRAGLIALGIKTNPRVWQANVIKVELLT